jgi:hypothetical protein
MAALRQQFTSLSAVRTRDQLNALYLISDHFIDAAQDSPEAMASSQREAAEALESGNTAAVLLKLLDSDDKDIAERACGVLWYVTTSFTSDSETAAGPSQASPQRRPEQARPWALWQPKAACGRPSCVKNPPLANLQVPAICTLTSFLTDTTACRAAAHAGAITALVALLRSPNTLAADTAAGALSRLAHNSHNRAKAQAEAGAAPLLAAACSSRQSEQATNALHLLLDNLMPTVHLPPQQEQQCCRGMLAVLRA